MEQKDGGGVNSLHSLSWDTHLLLPLGLQTLEIYTSGFPGIRDFDQTRSYITGLLGSQDLVLGTELHLGL
jgi:hypothetical protein